MFRRPDLIPKGDKAESMARLFLNWHPLTKDVQDVRQWPEWQGKEIDYIVTLTTGVKSGVEVKHDKHVATSPNFLFELLRLDSGKDCLAAAYVGWGIKTEAQRVLYCSPEAGYVALVSADNLRAGFQRHILNTRPGLRFDIQCSDATRTTMNILIPKTLVPHSIFKHEGGVWKHEKGKAS